jgi:hypothetical protein
MQPVQIKLNEIPLDLTPAQDSSVAQILETIHQDHVNQGHVVSSIYIDGAMWERSQDEALKTLPVSQVQRLDIYTQTPDMVASAGLQDLPVILGMVHDHTQQATALLRAGKLAEGMMCFLQGADMLHDALYFIRLLLDHRHVAEDHPARAGYTRINNELAQALLAFENAQQKQDWVLVADLMDYEIVPRLEELTALGQSLAQEG